MARVTIERALDHMENRFQLVVCAAYRAYSLLNGCKPTIKCNNKTAVTALREIECGNINVESIYKAVAYRYAKKNNPMSEDEILASNKANSEQSEGIFSEFNLNVED